MNDKMPSSDSIKKSEISKEDAMKFFDNIFKGGGPEILSPEYVKMALDATIGREDDRFQNVSVRSVNKNEYSGGIISLGLELSDGYFMSIYLNKMNEIVCDLWIDYEEDGVEKSQGEFNGRLLIEDQSKRRAEKEVRMAYQLTLPNAILAVYDEGDLEDMGISGQTPEEKCEALEMWAKELVKHKANAFGRWHIDPDKISSSITSQVKEKSLDGQDIWL